MMSEEIQVCEDVASASKCLLKHSFAIFRVDGLTESKLNRSWKAGRDFLSHASQHNDKEEEFIKKYRYIKNGTLLGFNRPSSQKLLFRAQFVDCNSLEEQPWPSDFDTGELCQATKDLVPALHSILLQVHSKIREDVMSIYCDGEDECEQSEHLRKKRRISHSFDAYCPLDYFLYTNLQSGIKCSEHVDRGILICISLSSLVAGLEVMSRRDGKFYTPEKLAMFESLYKEHDSGTSDLICILAGDQLLESLDVNDNIGILTLYPGIQACNHRVKQELAMARLSISYELRESANIKSHL
jgi:hypothetical protein